MQLICTGCKEKTKHFEISENNCLIFQSNVEVLKSLGFCTLAFNVFHPVMK